MTCKSGTIKRKPPGLQGLAAAWLLCAGALVGCASAPPGRPKIDQGQGPVVFEREAREGLKKLMQAELAFAAPGQVVETPVEYRQTVRKLMGGADDVLADRVATILAGRTVELDERTVRAVAELGQACAELRELCREINRHQTLAKEYATLAERMSNPASGIQMDMGLYADIRTDASEAAYAAEKHEELAAQLRIDLPDVVQRVDKAIDAVLLLSQR